MNRYLQRISAPVAETLVAITAAKRKSIDELTVFILDKPRHVSFIP